MSCPVCEKMHQCEKIEYEHVMTSVMMTDQWCGKEYSTLRGFQTLAHSDLADSELNREKLGITVGSVSFGQEHSKHFYNRFISALILGHQLKGSMEREKQACLDMLDRIAIVRIELANYDVIHINRELRETRTSFSAKIGMS